jgi:hypothetical protein
MNKEQVLNHYGSGVAVAEVLGITSSCVSRWQDIPYKHQLKLQAHSKGKLKAQKPKEKKKEPIIRVCYNLPKTVHDKFRRLCRKENLPMTKKALTLIENYIDS